MKRFLTPLLLLLNLATWGQDAETPALEDVSAWGRYTGENVYVLNPSQNGVFSVQEVTVNGTPYAFNHESNAFEIDLSSITPNEFVFVKVSHLPNTQPVIVNAESLVQESTFPLPSFIYNKKTKMLEWSAADLDAECTYRLEQLLYGKWITIKKLGKPSEMIAENFLPVMITGMNMFRIVQSAPSGNELASTIIKLKSPNLKVLLLTDRVKDAIEFTAVTHYELYDNNGAFLKRGTAKKIDVSDLPKGTYWVNFDGKEAIVTKK